MDQNREVMEEISYMKLSEMFCHIHHYHTQLRLHDAPLKNSDYVIQEKNSMTEVAARRNVRVIQYNTITIIMAPSTKYKVWPTLPDN